MNTNNNFCGSHDVSGWRLQSFVIAWIALAATTFLGCGGGSGLDIAPVTGVVTLDQKPLPDATVMFQPQEGRFSSGKTDAQGRYELRYSNSEMGARVGPHVVNIRTRLEDNEGRVIVKEFLPKRYHDKTELNADVKSENNTINFDLKASP